MGCTKSKVQDKVDSTLSDETSEMISQYESIQKRRVSYPIEQIFLPPIRKRRRSRCNSY
jgi:hypothetical protein